MSTADSPARDAPGVTHLRGTEPRAWKGAGIYGALVATAGYGGLAGLAYFVGPWSEHLGSFLGLYAVCWAGMLLASRGRPSWRLALAGALLFRAALLPLVPSLSDDIYRYVWEGRVQLAGFDPYVLAPGAAQLEPLRDALWQRVNHPQYAAIYPPASQLVFRALAHLGGVVTFKAALCLVDLATCALLAAALHRRRLGAARLVLYAWNPLVVVETAGSGHLEPLGVLPLLAAVVVVERRRALGWVLLAASTAAKYAAAITAPAFLAVAPPRGRAVAAVAVFLLAVAAPYAGAGTHLFDSLRVYAEHWQYNDLLFAFIRRLVSDPHRARLAALVMTGMGGIALAAWRRPLEVRVLATLTLTLLLSPTVHPWYLLWPLALVPLVPNAAILGWSATMPLAYLHLYPIASFGPFATTSWLPQLFEVVPVGVAIVVLWLRSRRSVSVT